jgi:hypothetical protein
MLFDMSQMPLADQSGRVAGRLEAIGDGHFGNGQSGRIALVG